MLCVVTGEARQEGTKGSDSVYLNVDGDCEQRIIFKKVGVPSGKLLVVHSVADGRTTVDGWYLGIHDAEDTDNVPPGPRKSGTKLTSLRAILHRKRRKAAVWKVDVVDGHSMVEVTANWDRSGGATVGWYLSVGPRRSKTRHYLTGDMKFASDIRLIPESGTGDAKALKKRDNDDWRS